MKDTHSAKYDDALNLADIILDVWCGGKEDASDLVDQEDDPEKFAYITQLAVEHADLIRELAYEGGLEQLIAEYIKGKEADVYRYNKQ